MLDLEVQTWLCIVEIVGVLCLKDSLVRREWKAVGLFVAEVVLDLLRRSH